MKEKIKTVYSCDHCNKKMFQKQAIVRHEDKCTKNPENWFRCIDCASCQKTLKTISIDNAFCGSYEREVHTFYCAKLNQYMYPPKVQKLANQYPENFEDEVVMPKECEDYNSIYNLPF